MGRGVSKVGGSTGALVKQAIANAESGGIPVTYEEVKDIGSASYGIDTGRLSESDKSSLARVIFDSVSGEGRNAKNSMNTVNDIHSGKVAQINISQMDSDGLKTAIQCFSMVRTPASIFAMEDALKLLSYYSQ